MLTLKLLPSGLALVCSPITCLNYTGILASCLVLNQGEKDDKGSY